MIDKLDASANGYTKYFRQALIFLEICNSVSPLASYSLVVMKGHNYEDYVRSGSWRSTKATPKTFETECIVVKYVYDKLYIIHSTWLSFSLMVMYRDQMKSGMLTGMTN